MSVTIKDIVGLIRNADATPSQNDRGNKVMRMFFPDSRYTIDFADDFRPEWQQFDTRQDAEYFGVWLNRTQRLTMTYCEGDWTLVECPDDACYFAEVGDCIRYYEAGFVARCIDANGNVVEVRQDREKFLSDTPEPQIGIGDVLAAVLS